MEGHLKATLYLHHGRSVEISAALAKKQKARVEAVKSHRGHFMVNCGSASDPRTWGMFLPLSVIRILFSLYKHASVIILKYLRFSASEAHSGSFLEYLKNRVGRL